MFASLGFANEEGVLRKPINDANKVKPQFFTFMQLVSLLAVPSFICVVTCTLFADFFHTAHAFVFIFVTTGIATCLFAYYGDVRRQEQPYRSTMALWILAALVVATVAGSYAYFFYYSRYWSYRDSFSYANILPSEPAASYADAGKIIFAREARIDESKAMGYKDGKTYCVAPILDDSDNLDVEFWAVGTDCCGARGSFSCDDAWDPKAKAGVVISHSDRFTQYDLAVKQAVAAYGLKSANEPLFVRWVVDPTKVEENLKRVGNGILFAVSVIFAMMAGSAAVLRNNQLKAQFVEHDRSI